MNPLPSVPYALPDLADEQMAPYHRAQKRTAPHWTNHLRWLVRKVWLRDHQCGQRN